MSFDKRVLLLDTNMLLLYLVSQVDASLLHTFKRVDMFAESDISLLARIISRHPGMITTPHVLAEASNFVDHSPRHRRREMQTALRTFVEQYAELYEEARVLVQQPEFSSVGIADTGLAVLCSVADLLTTDYRLAGLIQARGGTAMNFNHYRTASLLEG